MRLQGKTALITGAGRGIGRAIAHAFADEGANLVLASRTVSELNATADETRQRGAETLSIPTDLADDTQLDALVAQTYDRFGGVDLLVNNAGVAIHHPVPDIPIDVWDLTMRMNMRAPFLLTRAFWNNMVERGGGVIVNVSSISGKRSGAGNATYSASKFGIIGFTESLAQAGRSVNIRAVALCPGPVSTVMRAGNNPSEDPATILKPEDIAAAAVYIATQPARVLIREVVVELNPSGIA
ncbi:MAG: SDR family NAD(P)-dependent oxidoreductase [Candidatus Poribacteria bacterium]|nr:SDR family NAD(P)-dependent oxidoreductase [Candidatus Poribacteria bacterium]